MNSAIGMRPLRQRRLGRLARIRIVLIVGLLTAFGIVSFLAFLVPSQFRWVAIPLLAVILGLGIAYQAAGVRRDGPGFLGRRSRTLILMILGAMGPLEVLAVLALIQFPFLGWLAPPLFAASLGFWIGTDYLLRKYRDNPEPRFGLAGFS